MLLAKFSYHVSIQYFISLIRSELIRGLVIPFRSTVDHRLTMGVNVIDMISSAYRNKTQGVNVIYPRSSINKQNEKFNQREEREVQSTYKCCNATEYRAD